MSNFATPQWDSTDFGDEMCSKLFQANEGKKSNKKEGNIKKAKKKLKNLNSKMNPKLLKNIGQQITEVKNKINGKLTKDTESIPINSSITEIPKNKKKKQRKKLKINGETMENLGTKIKNFTKCKETLEETVNNEESETKKKKQRKKLKINGETMENLGTLTKKFTKSKGTIEETVNNEESKTKKKKQRKKLKINGETIDNLGKKIKNFTKSKETIENTVDNEQSETKKKKTKDIKKLHNDINSKLNEKPKKRKIKEKLVKLGDKIKDSNLVNDVSEKYTKTQIRLKNIRKDEDNELLLDSPKKNVQKSLRERMLEQLKASRFRYLNEQIYTSESKSAQDLFAEDPEAFTAYHEGYRQQVKKWPINPLDVIIKDIKKMPKNLIIADLGCGDAKLSLEVPQKVHSFDLVAANERVVACDMSKVPLAKNTVDVVIFCLSLMGTNLHDYLKEANRLLKVDGILKIAEVESRFDDVDNFIKGVKYFGFQNVNKNFSHNLFYFMDFKKVTNIKKTKGLPTLSLHPCLYKKR